MDPRLRSASGFALGDLLRRSFATSLPAIALLALFGGCGTAGGDDEESIEFNFQDGAFDWQAGVADFPAEREAAVEFVGDHRSLPPPFGPGRSALYVSALNISDDVFVFFKKRITGLEPSRGYRLFFEVGIVSNAARGCDVGAGAATWIKTGASDHEPVRVLDSQGVVRLDIDIGIQFNEGRNALLLGDMRNEHSDCADASYGTKSLDSGSRSLDVTSAADGSLWLIFGADSGFEVPFHLYFTSFRVRLEPRDP